ncbi:MAG: hypothetical protein HYZ72_07415 [Deltaproteobacteria bacterium]|nr:hypothetical protein [Deltaproteobacteria bacterium]
MESHDYMAGNLDLVVETIEAPDSIVVGRKGEFIALRHYETTSLSEKSVIAVYRHYRDGELVGVTILHASEVSRQSGV